MTQRRVKHKFTFFLLLVSIISAQEPSNYIVIEDLRPLILFNSYEQQLSQKEKEVFPPNSAFLIQKDRVTLSDNFSIATALESDGHKLFILLDASGQIKNSDQSGEVQIFNKTERINDTLVVKKANSVFIRDPIKNKRYRTLNKNEQVIRIFRYKNREYVQLLEYPVFGWLDTNDRAALERITFSAAPDYGFSDSEISRIRHSIERINSQIVDIFNLLNKKSGKYLTAPQWKLSIFENKIDCSIDGYQNELKETGLQLQAEILKHIRQKEFHVSGSADHFTIVLNN